MDWRRVFCWLNYPKHRDTEFDVGKSKEVTAKIVFCLIGYVLVDFLFVLKFLGNVGYVVALFVCFFLLRLHPFNASSRFYRVFRITFSKSSPFPPQNPAGTPQWQPLAQSLSFYHLACQIFSQHPKTWPCDQWQVDSIFSWCQSVCRCLGELDSTTYRRHY